MKFILVILALVAVSCSPNVPKANSYDEPITNLDIKKPSVGAGGEWAMYKVVVIEGNEYFACRTYQGYWVLCPKLPAKKP